MIFKRKENPRSQPASKAEPKVREPTVEKKSLEALESDKSLVELFEKLSAEEVAAEAVEEPPEAPAEAPAEPTLEELEKDLALGELEEKLAAREKAEAPEEFRQYTTFELPPGYEEVERYWIAKPFVWAAILYNPEKNERLYCLVEPSLTPAEKTILEMLYENLLDRLTYEVGVKDRDRVIAEKVMELLSEYDVALEERSIRKLLYYLKRNYLGYGKIDGLIRDPYTEDVSCDGLNVPIFLYHRKHTSIRTNVIFRDATELDLFVIRLVERAGKQISLGRPTVDASLPEGYRLQATLGTEVTTRGSSFAIRKYAEEPFTPVDLIKYGTFSPEMLAYLWLAAENKKNIMVIGGTASGKCVVGDTRVLLANSRFEKIGDLVEEAFTRGHAIKTDDGWVIADANFKVFSMTPDLKVRPIEVSRVWKRRAPAYLYHIKTRTGKELTTTPEHPFFVIEGGEVLERRACELVEGSFIATLRKVAYPGNSANFEEVVKHLGFSVKEIGDHFEVQSPKGRAIKIPKYSTPELLEIVGYVLGDGHIRKNCRQLLFHNADSTLKKRFYVLTKTVFQLPAKVRNPRGRVSYVETDSRALCKFLHKAFDIPLGRKAGKIDIHTILALPSSECRAFLRAIFDCESHIHIQKGTIELSSASEIFVKQLQLLLSRFGIVTQVRVKNVSGKPYWQLFVGGGTENLKKFGKEVGYLHPRKNRDLKKAIKHSHSPNFDVVPISRLLFTLKEKLGLTDGKIAEMAGLRRRTIGRYRDKSRNITRPPLQRLVDSLKRKYGAKADPVLKGIIQKLAQLATSDVLWDEIVSIDRVRPKEPWVYDLTVDSTHNFIANGVMAHNTCTLNALAMFVPPDAKIISIEDTREIALYQENWVPNVTREARGERAIDMYDLLRTALRQRPEILIVGEVRGKEALTLFQAMTTGHTVYGTMHAGSMQEMAHRLEGEPINVPHHMLSALDIVCLQLLTYFRDQRVRRNQSTIEIVGIDPGTGALRTNRIYERSPLTDQFEKVGDSRVLRDIARERGWSALRLEKELRNRRRVLEYLAERNIRRLSEVAAVIRRYYFEPEKVLKEIGATD